MLPRSTEDRLTRVLQSLRMRGTFYSNTELGAGPWSLAMPAIEDSVSFHVVAAGACWLRLEGEEPLELRAGDLALVPHGRGHDLLSSPERESGPRVDLLPQEYVSDNYSFLRYGGEGRAAQLICGIVSFEDPMTRELIRELPPLLTMAGDAASTGASLRDTLRLMAGELVDPQPGGAAVTARLADILLIQMIRSWITTDPDGSSGWLRALRDERIGRVIEAIHSDPGGAWSLDSLARVATMSRSAFAARFSEIVGEAPIAYLTRWRMNVAKMRLGEENVTASQLAHELGYRSDAAFNRAFARAVGQTPGGFRKQRRALAPG